MTRSLDSLLEVAGNFDAIVLDQFGVMHNGENAYPGAIAAVARLKQTGVKIAVLSNSGKRAEPNRARIADKGFDPDLFDVVMTSGEALWHDMQQTNAAVSLYPITAAQGDAEAWATSLGVALVDSVAQADAILLMGLPEGCDLAAIRTPLDRMTDVPVYCTNPDRASPRAGGNTVISPGALAHELAGLGHTVKFYGKPHGAVFRSTEKALDLPPERILMVGDSFEHDVAGGHEAGWSTAFVEGGLYHAEFAESDRIATVHKLADQEGTPLPDFTLRGLA